MCASRILINANIDSFARQRGVARYFREVTAGIIDAFGDQTLVLAPEAGDYAPAQYIRSVSFRGSRRFRIRDALASLIAAYENIDVVFNPYYGRLWTTASSIFTVYDMISELLPQHANRGTHLFVAEKKRSLQQAEVLLAISHATAQDILTCYPHLTSTKIVVTRLGVDQIFFLGGISPVANQQKPYFIYVGNRGGHKNFLRLLTAFGRSGLAKQIDLWVISPQGAVFSPKELELISQFRLSPAIKLISAESDEALRDYYAGALALVYPSEYEGFGLPILEAMASGTLVVTSNVSSMPEIGGEVAFYFDPLNTDSMVNCMQQVVNLSAQQRQESVTRGIARARTFTWDRCRQQTVDVIKQLLT